MASRYRLFMASDPYLIQQPNGTWRETRFRFKPGDRVAITAGTYAGQQAVVESLTGQWMGEHMLHSEPGYNVRLSNGQCVSVGWWMVEGTR